MKYLPIILYCIFLVSACDKKLDISPEDTLVDTEVFETEAGAEQALSEVYYNFTQAVTNYFSYTYGDFTTPLLDTEPFYNIYTSGNATPTDYYVVGAWTAYYKAINGTNSIIKKLPLYADFDATVQKQFIAEAKFLRAYCYLNLLCLYGNGALSGNMNGLGLPLQLTPFEGYNTAEIIPRSTNGEVYAQIIKDLTEAEVDLLNSFPDALRTRSRATKGNALALKCRTYLYMGSWEEAALAAEKVMEKSPSLYVLEDDLLQVFPPNPEGVAQQLSKEYLMALPISQMVSSSTSENNGIGGAYFYKRSFWINDEYLTEFEPGDLRKELLIWKGDSVYNPDHYDEKTTFKFNNRRGRDNVAMIRYAEVLLCRAEALARTQGVNEESVYLLNQIRQRAIPGGTANTVSDFNSPEELIAEILEERKFELAFEGLHRYDLIRTEQPLASPDIPENKKVLPIPQVEIDISNNIIQQNPGY